MPNPTGTIGPSDQVQRRHNTLNVMTEAQAAYQTPRGPRTTGQANLVLETAVQLEVLERELAVGFNDVDQTRRKDLVEELKNLPKPPALPQAMALAHNPGTAPKTFVLVRGDYGQQSEEVGAGLPAVLDRGRNER